MIMHRLNNSQQFYKAQIKQNLIQNVFSETHLDKKPEACKNKTSDLVSADVCKSRISPPKAIGLFRFFYHWWLVLYGIFIPSADPF